MVRTQTLVDLAVVVNDFLGALVDLVDALFLIGQDLVVFGLDGPQFLVELVCPAMQVLQLGVMVVGKIGTQGGGRQFRPIKAAPMNLLLPKPETAPDSERSPRYWTRT